jgi:hypothetical protein
MGKMVKGFTLILILVACLTPSYTNSTLVKGQVAKYVSVNVTSPIENQTYQTNIIPLNFTWDTNVNVSIIEKVDYSVNLDGQYGHHDGHDIAYGELPKSSIPSSYNTTINVPDGNHLLWVHVFVWYYVTVPSYFGNVDFAESLSEIVSFKVSPTTSPSPSPTPSVPEFSWLTILPILLTIPIALTIVRKRLQGKV